MALTDLAFVAYNPRRISADAFEHLKASIETHTEALEGWDPSDGYRLASSITCNRTGARIVGGEQRVRALSSLGQDWIHASDITWIDVPAGSALEKSLCIELNNREAQGDFTADVAELILELTKDSPDDDDPLGLRGLLGAVAKASPAPEVDSETLDAIPATPRKASSNRGEVYLLGNHRLMCGDSSSEKDLDRLLSGAEIHLVNMDPPYNVSVEPRSNNAIAAGGKDRKTHQAMDLARNPKKLKATHPELRPKDRPLANDFVSEKAFEQMLRAWFGNASRVLQPGRAFYIWGGYVNCANYPSALHEKGLYFSQAVIWVKEHPVLTRKDFMGNHEWCFYGWREGAPHQFFGPDNATDVWQVKKLHHQQMVHLTEKPIELAVRAIRYSTRQGENVLDLFSGSGSTLMGCEATGRKAYAMEIDPLYCDVIRRRWAEYANGQGCKWRQLTPKE